MTKALLTEANFDHYEQRARGGVGTLIVETSAVAYPVGATCRRQPSLSSAECVAGFTELAARVHRYGSKLFVQICHHGKTALVDTLEGRDQLVPSAPLPETDMAGFFADLTMTELMRMAEPVGGKMPTQRQASTDDIAEVIDQFGDAAQRVQASGCDGVEIHACHGYLLSSFLSPYWNRRDDSYGGSIEGRTRLMREVVREVRKRCGNAFGIIVRLDGLEAGIDGGITPALAAEHARAAGSCWSRRHSCKRHRGTQLRGRIHRRSAAVEAGSVPRTRPYGERGGEHPRDCGRAHRRVHRRRDARGG